MNKKSLLFGSLFGSIAVALGALAAHFLKSHISSIQLESFQTGVRYQMYHAILLLIIGFTIPSPTKLIQTAINLFIVGTLLFSFSIYLLSAGSIIGFTSTSFLGPVTPLGGMLLISGWVCILLFSLKNRNSLS